MRCASAEFLSALQRFVIRLFSSRTFYEGDVVDYTAASFFTTGTCPTPAAKTAAISGSYPEGVAIDAFGNCSSPSPAPMPFRYIKGPYSASPSTMAWTRS